MEATNYGVLFEKYKERLYWQWWRKKGRHARPAEKLITDVTKESVEDNASGPEKYFSHFLSLG